MTHRPALPLTERQQVRVFESNAGARVACLPLQAFPDFWVYAYLVLVDEYQVLIDCGSGFRQSNPDLEAGLQAASEALSTPLGLRTLTHVFITHGHIDHFGGLSYLRQRSPARIGVHELDLHTLTHTEERLSLVARRLQTFFAEAGVNPDHIPQFIATYKLGKLDYQPIEIDFTYEAVGMSLGPFEMLHTPGHCAGHVVIRLHDLLFSGDHVLSEITPHQSPEQVHPYTGLRHYLDSLNALRDWAGDVRLVLGGHNPPTEDLPARIAAIQQTHQQRLEEILHLLETPQTIAEVSKALFGPTHGYNILLALEEAGAHVEYLYQMGRLRIANLDDLNRNGERPVPIRYQRLD